MPATGNTKAAVNSTVVSEDGTRIAFERTGEGPPVILVSSALADRKDTEKLAGLLTQRFTVINHDRRGRGASGDAAAYAVDREIEDIAVMGDTQRGGPLDAGVWSAAAPTLVLTGGKSPAGFHRAAKALVDVLPAAEHRTLPGLNHGAVVMAPKRLAPALAEFLGG